MGDLLGPAFVSALVSGALVAALPLLWASLGELVSEQAGVLNVGLEGYMLAGALVGFAVAERTGSESAAVVAGAAAGLVSCAPVTVLCVRHGLDQVVVGIAVLLVVEGVTSVVHGIAYADSRPSLGPASRVDVPVLDDVPVLGDSLFSQHVTLYLAVVAAVVVAVVLRRTVLGLNLRAAGERPAALDRSGVSVTLTRTLATSFAGLWAGAGGAVLSVVAAGSFVPFITQGAGFVAIVLAMLARGRATWTVLGALLYGVTLSAATAVQVVGVDVPTDYVQMLPFVAVMAALVLVARRARPPAELAVAFRRQPR